MPRGRPPVRPEDDLRDLALFAAILRKWRETGLVIKPGGTTRSVCRILSEEGIPFGAGRVHVSATYLYRIYKRLRLVTDEDGEPLIDVFLGQDEMRPGPEAGAKLKKLPRRRARVRRDSTLKGEG